MLFEGGFTFTNFLVDVFVIFLFVMWFWLLITVFSDLFRRKDISAGGKILWLIVLVVLPYLGVFAYLLTQSGNMAERSEADAKKAREDLREIVGFSVADEITKLDQLKASGSITAAEYSKLRAKLV
ncbi:PLDc N-terminal domain-containing protein [Mesorhizobium sp. VNQ89]|uniref:SHOCT domain-containing protein n=1 Tax=Mesorhizobium quangtriensis TaxID=3157709 RepID=UPI0032B81878